MVKIGKYNITRRYFIKPITTPRGKKFYSVEITRTVNGLSQTVNSGEVGNYPLYPTTRKQAENKIKALRSFYKKFPFA